nr:MAG TPA: hypothetical protein [Caudoviricetes sp.]
MLNVSTSLNIRRRNLLYYKHIYSIARFLLIIQGGNEK